MKTIRKSVFETNSSSTHSFTIVKSKIEPQFSLLENNGKILNCNNLRKLTKSYKDINDSLTYEITLRGKYQKAAYFISCLNQREFEDDIDYDLLCDEQLMYHEKENATRNFEHFIHGCIDCLMDGVGVSGIVCDKMGPPVASFSQSEEDEIITKFVGYFLYFDLAGFKKTFVDELVLNDEVEFSLKCNEY